MRIWGLKKFNSIQLKFTEYLLFDTVPDVIKYIYIFNIYMSEKKNNFSRINLREKSRIRINQVNRL